MIKSIQRGVITGQSHEVKITISPVNPDKCFVILNGGFADLDNSYSQNIKAPYLISLTETQLTVNIGGGADDAKPPASWQVVEFN